MPVLSTLLPLYTVKDFSSAKDVIYSYVFSCLTNLIKGHKGELFGFILYFVYLTLSTIHAISMKLPVDSNKNKPQKMAGIRAKEPMKKHPEQHKTPHNNHHNLLS